MALPPALDDALDGLDGDSAPDDRSDDGAETKALRGGMVRSLLAVLVNVGVLTALVVYFGWVRSERMASYLGIDEAIFGMTVDEYARRSVQSVFILPLLAAGAGLVWVGFDQWLRRRRLRRGAGDRVVVAVSRWLWLGSVAVFLVGVVLWVLGYAATYVAGPLVCTAGLLLFLYSIGLRGLLPGAVGFAPLTEGILRGAVAILAAVGLFWSATNYATVEGTQLALDFADRVQTLPGVEIDSTEPLDIVAPGVETSCIGEGDDVRYRYSGLRLLESTGGYFFLVSDDWTWAYGVVVMLPEQSDGVRYTFVRDVAGAREDDFSECT